MRFTPALLLVITMGTIVPACAPRYPVRCDRAAAGGSPQIVCNGRPASASAIATRCPEAFCGLDQDMYCPRASDPTTGPTAGSSNRHVMCDDRGSIFLQ